MTKINRNIIIEELIGLMPDSVDYLFGKGIICIVCGEPVWGTLYELAIAKNYVDSEIDNFVDDLNNMFAKMNEIQMK